jgi:hypothetical protein
VHVVRALLLGVGAALAVALAVAVVLAIVGLYAGGHGDRAWTDVPVADRGFVHLARGDVVLLVAAFVAGAAGFGFSLRR